MAAVRRTLLPNLVPCFEILDWLTIELAGLVDTRINAKEGDKSFGRGKEAVISDLSNERKCLLFI